jgi:hypothetical protein
MWLFSQFKGPPPLLVLSSTYYFFPFRWSKGQRRRRNLTDLQKLTELFQDNSHSDGGINAGPGKNPVQAAHYSLRKCHEQENHKPEPESPFSFDPAKKSFQAQKHPFQLFHWPFLFPDFRGLFTGFL